MGEDFVDVGFVVEVVHASDVPANGLADDLEAEGTIFVAPALGTAGARPAGEKDAHSLVGGHRESVISEHSRQWLSRRLGLTWKWEQTKSIIRAQIWNWAGVIMGQ